MADKKGFTCTSNWVDDTKVCVVVVFFLSCCVIELTRWRWCFVVVGVGKPRLQFKVRAESGEFDGQPDEAMVQPAGASDR